MTVINFNKVIAYSKSTCKIKSIGRCAEYVKRAFQAGGAKYIVGNGWSNQPWCETNGFKLIGDFVPEDRNPRAHGNKPMQFPNGYKQQTGDVCLIKHGEYGHICYAMSNNINDWVSDFFQRSPGQQDGTGPYCYKGNIERVQFWRHESVLNNAPVIDKSQVQAYNDDYRITESSSSTTNYKPSEPVTVKDMSGMHDGSKKKSTTGIVLGYHMRQK